MLRRFALLAWIGLLAPAPLFAASLYSVTDLGTLGGTSSFGTAINDAGTAVGYSTLVGGETRAFIWTPGPGMQSLGVLGAGDSQAFDINNNGNVVGVTTNQAFRWTSPSGMILIDSANTGSANGLNAGDQGVGSRTVIGGDRTLVWSSSNAITNPHPAFSTSGAAINDLGQFVGTANSGAGGYYSTGVGFPTLLGAFLPTDLNNSRQIVGATGGIATLLDFDGNTTTLLGKLSPTDTFSNALGINQAGTIVGVSEGSGAFIADSTLTLQSLTSLLDNSFSGWTILTATDINSSGQIIGVGEFNGVSHAVILNPVPEPTSMALTSLALVGFVWFARRAAVTRGRSCLGMTGPPARPEQQKNKRYRHAKA